MRIISFQWPNGTHDIGVINGDGIVSVRHHAPDLPTDLGALLGQPDWRAQLDSIAGLPADVTLDGIKFDPLIRAPHAIWALALNFKSHIQETGLTTNPDFPHLFMRHASAQVGHGQPLLAPAPSVARAYDYEGELAVVIGLAGRHIPREKAYEHVAGYTIFNEGSVREFQTHNRQFGLGKNFEASGSLGPWLVTPDELGLPSTKTVRTIINGVERQRAPLDDMLFDVADVIHYLSTGYTLRPGDVIAMGTPGALHPQPGDDAGDIRHQFGPIKYAGMVHMVPGDEVHVEIDGIGRLSNTVVADAPAQYRVGLI